MLTLYKGQYTGVETLLNYLYSFKEATITNSIYVGDYLTLYLQLDRWNEMMLRYQQFLINTYDFTIVDIFIPNHTDLLYFLCKVGTKYLICSVSIVTPQDSAAIVIYTPVIQKIMPGELNDNLTL